MTNYLTRLFIKDRENVENPVVRASYGMLASVIGIIFNLFLFAIKLVVGLVTSSISVLADAFNNLSDAASSIIGFVGVRLASRPADKEHPFGHGRYEYIAALIVSFLIFQVAFTCFKSSVQKIIDPKAVHITYISIAILLLSVVVKIWLAIFNRTLGRKISSSVLKATAADAISDALVTSVTVIALIISHYTGILVDGYMGVIVSIIVFIAGVNIAKDTLEPLLGTAIDKELYEKISTKILEYEGIKGTHDLILHNYGPTHTMATIHCEVSNDMELTKAHEIIDRIERDFLRDDNICMVIHLDPIEINNMRVVALKERLIVLIEQLEPRASIHDFRMVPNEEKNNLIFELVIPYDYSKKQERDLIAKIKEGMNHLNEGYEYVIQVEKSFISD